MIEFFETYGLWFVLGAVFLLMNLFGMGCCGARHRHQPRERFQDDCNQDPGAGKVSEAGPRSHSISH